MRQGDRERRIDLERNALEVRRAARTHQKLGLVARGLGEPGQHLLVSLARDVAERLAAPGADEKEDVEHRGAGLAGEGDHVVQLGRVVVGHGEVDLEHEPGASAGVDAGHGPGPGA